MGRIRPKPTSELKIGRKEKCLCFGPTTAQNPGQTDLGELTLFPHKIVKKRGHFEPKSRDFQGFVFTTKVMGRLP